MSKWAQRDSPRSKLTDLCDRASHSGLLSEIQVGEVTGWENSTCHGNQDLYNFMQESP